MVTGWKKKEGRQSKKRKGVRSTGLMDRSLGVC
jgi:hypothetical protein